MMFPPKGYAAAWGSAGAAPGPAAACVFHSGSLVLL